MAIFYVFPFNSTANILLFNLFNFFFLLPFFMGVFLCVCFCFCPNLLLSHYIIRVGIAVRIHSKDMFSLRLRLDLQVI